MSILLYSAVDPDSKNFVVTTMCIHAVVIFFMNDNSPPCIAELQHHVTTL